MVCRHLVTLGCAGAWLVLAARLSAADLPSPDRSIPEVINACIADALAARQITPAPPAEDLVVLRRTTLDLAGRIPTVAELQEFQNWSPSEKRERLVERLLDSPDYALHLRNEWDALLLDPQDSNGEWRAYLLRAAQENRGWDQMFADMLTAKDDDPARRGALQFLKARARSVDELTNDTSTLFFGVSINCAKCHDHPLVEDWKQDHYYGLSSFFSRTYLTRDRRLAEKPYGEVKFKTTKGVEKSARFMFLTGDTTVEPVVEFTPEQRKAIDEAVRKQQQDEKADPPAEPPFQPRLALVEAALRPENRGFFARAAVNRIWARLFGRGLVAPVDQMHSNNPASHPELLAWLERDFIHHGYDVKRLIRGVVLSEPYARSSQWTGAGEAPGPETYAVAAVRPLSPRQLSLSLTIASGNPQSFARSADAPAWFGPRQNLENQAGGFASLIELPGENFQVSLTESLLFSNNDRLQNDYLRDSGDRLVGVLKGLSDDEQVVQTAYHAVLSRPASPEEVSQFRSYLQQRSDRRVAGLQQLVWVLFTSPEFRFNY